MLPPIFRLRFACLVALLGLLGWGQSVQAGVAAAKETVAQAHQWGPASAAHVVLGPSEALVLEAVAPRGPALALAVAGAEGFLLLAPTWRQAAALAALAVPRAPTLARSNSFRARLLRAALSPNAP